MRAHCVSLGPRPGVLRGRAALAAGGGRRITLESVGGGDTGMPQGGRRARGSAEDVQDAATRCEGQPRLARHPPGWGPACSPRGLSRDMACRSARPAPLPARPGSRGGVSQTSRGVAVGLAVAWRGLAKRQILMEASPPGLKAGRSQHQRPVSGPVALRVSARGHGAGPWAAGRPTEGPAACGMSAVLPSMPPPAGAVSVGGPGVCGQRAGCAVQHEHAAVFSGRGPVRDRSTRLLWGAQCLCLGLAHTRGARPGGACEAVVPEARQSADLPASGRSSPSWLRARSCTA